MFAHQPINHVQGSVLGTEEMAISKAGTLPFWSLAGRIQLS